MSKANEHNSSLIQILLDLANISSINEQDNNIHKQTLELLDSLKQNYTITKKTDDIFNSHQYNDKKIHFAKLENFNRLQILDELTAPAIKILMFIIQVSSQDNLISLKINDITKILNISKPTIIKAIQELIDNGCISIFKNRTKEYGTIYMLNPEIATTGKRTHKGLFKKITLQTHLDNFEDLNECIYNVITSKTIFDVNNNINDQKYLCFNSVCIIS